MHVQMGYNYRLDVASNHLVVQYFLWQWLTETKRTCVFDSRVDTHIYTCMKHNISHVLWSGLWKCTNAPFSNFRVSVFQFDQEEEGRSFSHRVFICLLQSLIFFTGLISEGKRDGVTCTASPPPQSPPPRLFFWSVGYLKQLEQLVSLCASSCGDTVSGITLLRMSFSVAIMCLTRKLAASLMLRLS